MAITEEAFPRYDLRLEDMIAEGDKVAVRATMTGRHLGVLSSIPPTGKEVRMPIMVMYRIAEGKIAEHWIITDQMGLMQQLEVATEPEPNPS